MVERLQTSSITVEDAREIAPSLAGHLDAAPGNAQEIVETLIADGGKLLSVLREKQECPVCQAGAVRGVPQHSCGIEDRCDNCGEFFLTSQVTMPDPGLPDTEESLLRFGWEIHQARGRLAKRQAES